MLMLLIHLLFCSYESFSGEFLYTCRAHQAGFSRFFKFKIYHSISTVSLFSNTKSVFLDYILCLLRINNVIVT